MTPKVYIANHLTNKYYLMTDTGDNNVLRPQESKYQNIFQTLCILCVAKALLPVMSLQF